MKNYPISATVAVNWVIQIEIVFYGWRNKRYLRTNRFPYEVWMRLDGGGFLTRNCKATFLNHSKDVFGITRRVESQIGDKELCSKPLDATKRIFYQMLENLIMESNLMTVQLVEGKGQVRKKEIITMDQTFDGGLDL